VNLHLHQLRFTFHWYAGVRSSIYWCGGEVKLMIWTEWIGIDATMLTPQEDLN